MRSPPGNLITPGFTRVPMPMKRGEPSFNACRETCRELAYHYNLMITPPDNGEARQRLEMMRALARHLVYFVGGKLENAKLGEFCCSSRLLRLDMDRD